MGPPEDEERGLHLDGPRHEARIHSGFWMFDAPCTQALWEAVMGENPSHCRGLDRPVEQVSWEDCQVFLKRLNDRLEGLKLALPSDSQWEYACRAGTSSARYHQDLEKIAWYEANSGGETHPVRGKAPNAWGLYDMLGNVWEWCMDAWRSEYSDRGASDSAKRVSVPQVIRGGSWRSDPQRVRAANRSAGDPAARVSDLGFRCAEFRGGF